MAILKTYLYKTLGMEEYFWGDCFEIDVANEDLSSEEQIFKHLDAVCLSENRTPLNGKWKKLNYAESCTLLLNALQYDLAYSSCEVMPFEQAKYYFEALMSKIDPNTCLCYTNWTGHPWDGNNGASWSPITENTFDMAIVVMDRSTMIFTYFISED